MGTPNWTPALGNVGVFLRSTPLNGDDWLDLVEKRVKLVSPLLNSMTLSTLEKVECLGGRGGDHSLSDEGEGFLIHADEGLSLTTQGIFGYSCRSRQYVKGSGFRKLDAGGVSREDGHLYFWGFTRKGAEWILVRVKWMGIPADNLPGCNSGYEHAVRVDIRRSDLVEICEKAQVPLERIWERIGEEASEWEERQKHLYRRGTELAATFSVEACLARHLKEKTDGRQ